jgi:predicted nucleotidyltransferase
VRRPIPPFIRVVVDRVVTACDPEEVLLFGSFAKGLQNRHSDIDLLIVLSNSPSPRQQDEITDAAACVPLHVDLLLHTRRTLAEAHEQQHDFLGSVLRSAVSLYVRTNTPSGPRVEGSRAVAAVNHSC